MKTNTNNRFMAAFTAILLSVGIASAQAPQAIPYQAVVRNNAGNVLANKSIGLRFSLRDVSATGTVVYQEVQTATTNALGLFSVNVGQGTLGFGYKPLTVVNWQTGNKFLEVEIDTTGGTTYKSLGTQQLLSVPYALNANNGVPAGTIVAFGGDTSKIPSGWILCDGRELSTTDTKYAALYDAIGSAWGSTGAGKFNAPYTLGEFLRGVSNGNG
ncbi:tail fiber protein [Parasediminibacterium sp. JCM 36343]|uniref:tail fiber protein n=1 Tax=Parasediminibacterium sp. JCM 36343 TaxID=3374279 RepID=UPI00397D340A